MSMDAFPADGRAAISAPIGNEASLAFPGWRVLLGATLGLAFSPGPMIFGSMGMIAPFLAAAHGWSRGQIMLSLTLFNVAGLLVAPYTGRLIDRYGVRAVLLPSLVLLAAGFAALAFLSSSLTGFYAVAFVWGALTIGTQSISYTKLISGWFVAHRGLAIGIAAAGLGAGYSIVPLLMARLLAGMGWQGAYALLGLLVLAVPLLVNWRVAHPNPLAPDAQGEAEGVPLGQALRSPAFALMALSILLASAALTGVVPHMALLALDRGFSKGDAAITASVYGLSTIVGRVIVGWLADRFSVPRVAALFFGLSMAGFALAGALGAAASLPLLIFLSLMIGLGFGAESDVIALLIIRYFGRRAFGAIYGWLLSAFLVGASIGAPLFGFGHDRFHSYGVALYVATGVMALAVVLMLALSAQTGRPQGEGQ
ncbi:MFS transporter [Novosphingobium rosa]|uniref:MFS transporter n=1 Tax=Novosphingobium rosa TaxID=76978 RepID=UPI00082CF10F|nr:MFS transporter [Novosphingobium rosa]